MRNFFEAKRIAVVGASRNPQKVGHIVFRNLNNNKELKVFPINSNAFEILGEKSYPDILSIPFPIDMVVIAIPAESVPEILEQCGRKEINKVIIISAGFSESGNEELNDKLKEIAEKYDIKIIGPNVLGIINPYKKLNASFFKELPERGNIGLISQSGAVGTAILDKALEMNVGFSGFISLGNMLNQDFINALGYFANDRYTDVIMLYIESLKENTGKEFVELCKNIARKKRIIAIKAGKTFKGVKAAKTHTASLASSPAVYSGAFKQAGIIEVDSLDELFLLAEIFSKYTSLGRKAGIITNAGGLGVLAADYLSKIRFEIPEIPEKILEELDSFMPRDYSRDNPLDILGDALGERYGKVLKVLGRRDIFDFFVVIISPQEMTQPLETAQVLANFGKPVFVVLQGGKSFEIARKFLIERGKIVLDDVSDIRVLGKIK